MAKSLNRSAAYYYEANYGFELYTGKGPLCHCVSYRVDVKYLFV